MSITFKGALDMRNTAFTLPNQDEKTLNYNLKFIGADKSGGIITNAAINTKFISGLSSRGISYVHPLTVSETFLEFADKKTGRPAPLSKKDYNLLLTAFNAAAMQQGTDVSIDFNA